MRIQHNILAMNAYRNYNTNTSALAKNLEKLSSGYKINRAGDDAAGLAISEKMRAQITGLNAAQKNVKDGISLVKTAEGAMQEIQDMLNRMDYLATQSANGTYDDPVDRLNLQKEVDALREEINRIADSANFNGINLLDGSMDAKNTTGRVNTLEAEQLTQMTIPAAGTDKPNTDMDADKTVLKKAGDGAKKTEFTLDLRTLAANGADGDVMEISIGDDKITINFSDTADAAGEFAADGTFSIKSGAISTEDLAKAIAKAFNGADPDTTPGTIDGQDFEATVKDHTVTFKQLNDPTGDTDTVAGALTVKVDYTDAAGTAVPFADGTPSSVGGTADTAAGVDGSAAVAAVYKTAVSAPTLEAGNTITIGSDTFTVVASGAAAGATDVSIDDVNSADKLAAFIASKATDTDYDITSDGADLVYTAKNAGAVGGGASGPASAPTAVTVTAAQGTGTNAPTINIANIGAATTTGAEAVAATKTLDASGLDKNAIKTAADKITGIADGDIQIQKNADDKLELVIGGKVIGTSDEVVNGTATSFNLKDADGNSLGAITAGGAYATADFTRAVDTGLTYTAATTPAPGPGGDDAAVTGPKGQYESKTVLIQQGAAEKADQLASTTLTLDDKIVKDGGVLKIGDTKFVFKVGADSTVKAGDGETLIDLSAYEAGDAKLIDAAGVKLSNETASDAFDLGYNGDGKLGVYEQEGQEKYKEDILGNMTEFNKLFSSGTAAKTEQLDPGEELTFQIGDTSDDYNQMKLSIGDMHVDAMGTEGGTSIAEIDISNQQGAHAAIQVIKDAINYVSGVRGDLGAAQNRLEHTANNLSVMAENIQDAESTIRDTDIAEEMMAYTKNNILVQSAQAMLAQANAVPQGVLQLLG